MPAKKTGYSSYIDHFPKFKVTKRITMPQIPKRPFRFQIRSIIRHDELRNKADWTLNVHRRGIGRQSVGPNQLEARAVPEGVIQGYLTERILYATLINLFHFVPGIDFLFQSSVDGGRLEMGGLVADFLFPILRVVINPLGPQHYQFRNVKKDEEQIQALAEMGYQCYLIDESVIYDEFQLEEFLRRVFGGMSSGGGDSGGGGGYTASTSDNDGNEYDSLYADIVSLESFLYSVF